MDSVRKRNKVQCVLLILAAAVLMVSAAVAQDPHERTIEEIKAEAVRRAENGIYPLIGLDPADVREALASVKTRDKDEWAAAFMTVGDKYAAEAKALEATDPQKANADYIRAWRLYSFGRWPFPASPKKQESYHKAIAAFLAHAHYWDPPL
jgi:esterase FrsA